MTLSHHTIRLGLAVLFAALPCLAQPIYKTVDEQGKVSYSDHPPGSPDPSQETTQVEVDTDRNIYTKPAPPDTDQGEFDVVKEYQQQEQKRALIRDKKREQKKQAEAALEKAKAELQAGQSALPGDFIGKKSGGVRPTLQRLERLKSLQQNVDKAQKALDDL